MFAMGRSSGLLKTTKFITGAAWLTCGWWRSNPAIAQNTELIPPEPNNSEQLPPLPSKTNPLQTVPTPPDPNSVGDIPGKIKVKQFDFVGNTVFSDAELNRAIANYTEEPISFAQLVRAADRVSERYVDQGYVTSGAYIPEQSLRSGRVQIQVVEGSLAEIEVEVEGGLKESYVRDRLDRRIDSPLNIDRLQSALQLLQLNPLITSLNAELSAGIEPGTNILSVSATSADTFKLQTRLSNNRNLSVGTFERGIELEEASLLGIGDRLQIAYDNTDGSNQYSAGYTFPLNSLDGSLEFNFRWAENEIVQSSFEAADLDIASRNYNLTWRQPVFQRANSEVSQELALSLTAGRRESDSTILDRPEPLTPGANETGEIRTSVVSFSQEWLQRSSQQVISARSQFNLGVDAFGATILNNEPDSQFFSWRGQFAYLRSLSQTQETFDPTLLLRSEIQLAADPLISTEQFSLGGANTVRGYRQDALLTDSGFLATAELRLPIVRFKPIDATLQFSPFLDFGTGWNNDGEETEFDTAIGTGFGLLLQTPEKFSARIDWGVPLINSDSQGSSLQEDGIYFQLQYDLF